jgi:hypothetical protein
MRKPPRMPRNSFLPKAFTKSHEWNRSDVSNENFSGYESTRTRMQVSEGNHSEENHRRDRRCCFVSVKQLDSNVGQIPRPTWRRLGSDSWISRVHVAPMLPSSRDICSSFYGWNARGPKANASQPPDFLYAPRPVRHLHVNWFPDSWG